MFEVKNNRPKLKVQSTNLENIFNVFSVAMILGLFVYVLYMQQKLPDSVPTHIGKGGEIDGWGSPRTILLLRSLTAIMFIALYLVSKKPHLTNFPIEITEKNANEIYRIMKEAMSCFNLAIVIGFGIMIWEAVELARGNNVEMFVGAILFIIIVPLAVLLYYSLLIWQKNREINKRDRI